MIRLLSGLLAIQIALVGFLYWPADKGAVGQRALITGISEGDVQSVSIRSLDDEKRVTELTLKATDQGWAIGDTALPADASKIETILRALLTSDAGFPIAQTDAAARRFEVSEDSYQRKLVLRTGSKEVVAYIGSSPAFRKVHARVNGQPSVFVIELNSFDAETDTDAWLDRSLLAIRDVESLQIGDEQYQINAAGWMNSAAEAVDAQAMETLLSGLASLQVSGVLDTGELLENAEAKLFLKASTSEEKVELELLHDQEADRYYVRPSAYEQVFDVSAFDAERLIESAAALSYAPGRPTSGVLDYDSR